MSAALPRFYPAGSHADLPHEVGFWTRTTAGGGDLNRIRPEGGCDFEEFKIQPDGKNLRRLTLLKLKETKRTWRGRRTK